MTAVNSITRVTPRFNNGTFANGKTVARWLCASALVAGALGAANQARANDLFWSIGVASPGVQVAVGNAPQVVYPQVVYQQPQVVYQRPQVVYQQPQVVYPHPHGGYPQRVVVVPQPVVYQHGWHRGWGHHHGHGQQPVQAWGQGGWQGGGHGDGHEGNRR